MSKQDDELEEWFSALRQADRARAPQFRALLDPERDAAPHRRWMRTALCVAAAAAIVAAAARATESASSNTSIFIGLAPVRISPAIHISDVKTSYKAVECNPTTFCFTSLSFYAGFRFWILVAGVVSADR